MTTATMSVAQQKVTPTADRIVLVLLLGFVAALQVSIALANILLAATLLGWAGLRLRERALPSAPPFFLALTTYALFTLVASAFSVDPAESFVDSRQLLLFLIVPAVYDLARGGRASTVADVIISVGAASAAFGIVQYGVLHYDNL